MTPSDLAALIDAMKDSRGELNNFVLGDFFSMVLGDAVEAAGTTTMDAIRQLRAQHATCRERAVAENGVRTWASAPNDFHHGLVIERDGLSLLLMITTGNYLAPSDEKFTRRLLRDFEGDELATDEELASHLEARRSTIDNLELRVSLSQTAAASLAGTPNGNRFGTAVIKLSPAWPDALRHPAVWNHGVRQTGTVDHALETLDLLQRGLAVAGFDEAYRSAARSAAERTYVSGLISDDGSVQSGLEAYAGLFRAARAVFRADAGIPGRHFRAAMARAEAVRIQTTMRTCLKSLREIEPMLRDLGHVGSPAEASDHNDGRTGCFLDSRVSTPDAQALCFRSDHNGFVAVLGASTLEIHRRAGAPRYRDLEWPQALIAKQSPMVSFVLDAGGPVLSCEPSIAFDAIRAWSDFEGLVSTSHCCLEEDLKLLQPAPGL